MTQAALQKAKSRLSTVLVAGVKIGLIGGIIAVSIALEGMLQAFIDARYRQRRHLDEPNAAAHHLLRQRVYRGQPQRFDPARCSPL